MAIYLEDSELEQSYKDSETWSRQFSTKFSEYERLADNELRPGIPKNHPKVNDGTLSSQLTETAMRRFQQLFSGKFQVRGAEQWFVVLVNILWKRVLVPGADSDADFYTKFWNIIYRSSKYGAAHWFAFFCTRDDYTGTDFNAPYTANVKLESGKTSLRACNYVWVDFYFTKMDLRRIIDGAETEDKESKKDKRDSYNTWETALLEEFLKAGPTQKDDQDQNPTERKKETEQTANPYKLSVCFQRGIDAPFLTVIPSMGYKVCRRRKNENPSGRFPVGAVYNINNLENPNGKGAVQTAGSIQNILDEFARADVLATQIALEPPTQIKGNAQQSTGFSEKTIVWGPRKKWRVGTADVSVVEGTTSGYAQISERFGRYKSNLMNQLGSFDTTVSAGAGNPEFSKTPAGVANLGSRANDVDNFFIRSYASGFKDLAETLMNLYLANMEGKDDLEITKEEAEELSRAGWSVDPGTRKVNLDYDKIHDWKVEFVPDIPNASDDKDKQGLIEGIKTVTENEGAIPAIQASGYQINLGELYVQYLNKLGIDQIDKIISKVEGADQQGGGQAGADQNQPKGPSESINFKDMPASGQIQMAAQAGIQLTPADVTGQPAAAEATSPGQAAQSVPNPAPAAQPDQQAALQAAIQQTMQQLGVDSETAQQIMAARQNGMTEEQIAAALRAPVGGAQ